MLFVVSIENLKILKYHTLFLSIICSKCKNEDQKIFKDKESIKILKIYNYFKKTVEENISQEFRLRNIDEARNNFVEEIEQHELMIKKHRKVYATLQ